MNMRILAVLISTLITLFFLAATSKAQNFSGVYRSVDGGQSWQLASSGLPEGVLVNTFMRSGNRLYVATNEHGLYFSDDEGQSWVVTGKKLPAKIKTIGDRKGVLFAAPWRSGVLVSFDGGLTWQERNLGLADPEVNAFLNLGALVFAATGTGISYTWNDGNSWVPVLSEVQVNDLIQIGESIIAATTKGILRSEDLGKTWVSAISNSGVHQLHRSGEFLFALTFRAGILKSSDQGKSWEIAQRRLPSGFPKSISSLNNGRKLFAGYRDGLYYSADQGEHWQKMETAFPPGAAVLELQAIDQHIIFAGVEEGHQ